MGELNDLVSVVIPTTCRPELANAIRSVRSQRGVPRPQVVVVNDSSDEAALLDVDADVKLWTGGGRRGGYARNAGVRAATGDWIAFLDDDDEWSPTKLASQLKLARSHHEPDRVVVGSRHIHVNSDRTRRSRPGPRRLMASDEEVDKYLFRRRRPSVRRSSIYTSTLLCSRSLALEVAWREDLARHQDWDWLIRVDRVAGTKVMQVAEPVVRIQTGSSNSISAGGDWRTSKAWADEMLQRDDIYVDFLAAQPLRYALNMRSMQGVSAVLRAILSRRRIPSMGPLLIGAAGLIDRRRLERIMTYHRKRANT